MAESIVTEDKFDLNSSEIPSAVKINEVIRDVANGDLSPDYSTLLRRPIDRYLEVVRLYPLGSRIEEFDEIAEAAAVGDELAIALEWALIMREAQVIGFDTDAFPGDTPRDREVSGAEYLITMAEKDRADAQLSEPIESILQSTSILDSSIASIEGQLVVGRMKLSEPEEL